MHENPDYHEDYSNYNEFGPEPASIPDELKICGNCAHCDVADQPVYIRTPGGSKVCGGQCLYPASGCTDFENDADIMDGAVFVPFDGRTCENFEPSPECLAQAEDYAEYDRDPYAYSGVDRREFY